MARGRQIVQGDTVEEFWALRDVSFQIPRGARVGILGRNGAGKSTLLKLLSRITEPTSGRIQINGRVASLLEVGTGFHPELTGRENIFLNGAILGMSRREIDSKFDAIVAFAEIERFLDTPVKRYSSGMYVRLAFAVAAHLDPEILIIDEVLAVGDSDFQRKCLGKMDSISKDGRTILFVSHNLLAIQKLCNQAILLKSGRLHIQSTVDTVVDSYISIGSATDYISDDSNLGPKIREVRLLTPEPRIDRDIEILVKWHLPSAIPGLKVGLGINTWRDTASLIPHRKTSSSLLLRVKEPMLPSL
ncbi:MAG: ABC transporter ATP-binding protein [Betaproteobacteria bacterium]|nr:ABC transporter ATP-binding protein [Betaproteobacteria bacterium]